MWICVTHENYEYVRHKICYEQKTCYTVNLTWTDIFNNLFRDFYTVMLRLSNVTFLDIYRVLWVRAHQTHLGFEAEHWLIFTMLVMSCITVTAVGLLLATMFSASFSNCFLFSSWARNLVKIMDLGFIWKSKTKLKILLCYSSNGKFEMARETSAMTIVLIPVIED